MERNELTLNIETKKIMFFLSLFMKWSVDIVIIMTGLATMLMI